MATTLNTLRQTPQPTPVKFLGAHPACWIQYYDDTGTKDPAKALSERDFDAAVARRKQEDHCAVCFSLQAFGDSRTKEGLLLFRNMGVDVDLVAAPERHTLSMEEIDRRKEEYLTRRLQRFPLKPHWLIETRHGFHVLFRVRGEHEPERVGLAADLNRQLVAVLGGDPNAALLTQVLRVPGTFQFKDPEHPFLCRLLMDNAATIHPYDLETIRGILAAHQKAQEPRRAAGGNTPGQTARVKEVPAWQEGLNGVPEGRRNATAASVIGAILVRLPEYLWETAGWGGLKEWNQRNSVPLPEPELRAVYQSIARRERTKREQDQRGPSNKASASITAQVDVRIEDGKATHTRRIKETTADPRPATPTDRGLSEEAAEPTDQSPSSPTPPWTK